MKQIAKELPRYVVAGIVGGAALFWNGHIPTDARTSLVSTADARGAAQPRR